MTSGDLPERVVEAVANAESADPQELPPLFRSIDPEALDTLFSENHNEVERLVFRYHGYEITVTGDGSIELRAV